MAVLFDVFRQVFVAQAVKERLDSRCAFRWAKYRAAFIIGQ